MQKKVHLGRTMHWLPQRLKSFFLIVSSEGFPKRSPRSEEKNSIALSDQNGLFPRILAHCEMCRSADLVSLNSFMIYHASKGIF